MCVNKKYVYFSYILKLARLGKMILLGNLRINNCPEKCILSQISGLMGSWNQNLCKIPLIFGEITYPHPHNLSSIMPKLNNIFNIFQDFFLWAEMLNKEKDKDNGRLGGEKKELDTDVNTVIWNLKYYNKIPHLT